MTSPTNASSGTAASQAGARIVADIGGTNARFATVDRSVRGLENVDVLACIDHSSIDDAISAYIANNHIGFVEAVCLAVAGPAEQDFVDLPNSQWSFSRSMLESTLGAPLKVINDFTAQALCIDLLDEDELVWFGDPQPAPDGIKTVIGPGTGLGVAVMMPSGEIIPSEGGHVGFAATTEHEIDLLGLLFARFRRVSIERLISGPGLENLYWANSLLEHGEPEASSDRRSAREIIDLAQEGEVVCRRSIEDFFDILASFAGDMALATWSTGGVYLSGGMLRRLMRFLDAERFRARFEDKGRFTRFCETVPIGWITAEYPGLLGCSAALHRS
jgi:glucokinase